jgi:hypothetical protein
MGKKSKRKKQFNCLLKPAKTLKLGKKLSIEDVHADFVVPELEQTNRRPSTLQGLRRNVHFWSTWWQTQHHKPLPIRKIDQRHLRAFRDWCLSVGVSVTGANRAVNAVKQILQCAKRHGFVRDVPAITALPHRGVAPKIFPSDEEIERIWEATSVAKWPNRTASRSPLPYSPSQAWQALLVFLRVYGMRIQELVRLESSYRSLEWGNVFPGGLTPNPEGRCECPYGWLSYVPQKQERVKPDPLFLPLTSVTSAVLTMLHCNSTRKGCVFDWPLSSISFYGQWHVIMEKAGIKPRAISGVEAYTPKHFRKAATTAINLHRPGLAPYIVGHAGDRSGTGSVISSKHYDNQEQAVLDCMLTIPMPKCFSQRF